MGRATRTERREQAGAAGGRAGSAGRCAAPPAAARWDAVLFDLDGTLLDIDGEGFLDAYVEALTDWWAPHDPAAFRQAVMAASVPIFAAHPGRTNGDVFRSHLAGHLGLAAPAVAGRMRRFHSEALPLLRYPARPADGAEPCVRRCLDAGLRVAVATTPIYMPEVVELRLRWAGLAGVPWDLVTHSEVMCSCKPHQAYFAETAERLGLAPDACVMVGDDPLQDGPARDAGMAVLLRGSAGGPGWTTLADVAAALARRGL